MIKKLLPQLFILLLFSSKTIAQCTYPAANTAVTVVQTLCVDAPASTVTSPSFNSTQFLLVNVVQGFVYSFAVGDIYTGVNENINIYNATSNAALANASGASGASISAFTATYSGQIKVIVSRDSCDHTTTTNFTITQSIVSIGNTSDSQTTFGTNTWVGHVYNYPGGNFNMTPSPSSPTNANPFTAVQYVGSYNVASQNIAEGFGGDGVCFPVQSGGVVRTNILTQSFAVRYRMKSTLNGCFMLQGNADDGLRLYINNTLVFNEWKDQGASTYANLFMSLDGDDDLTFDFYENSGGNTANLSIVAFNPSSNTASPAASSLCSGATPTLITGSNYAYNGGTVNPTIGFQWQSSTDNVNFTNISGATSKDYTPPAQSATGANNVINYYRRQVFSVSFPSACRFNSSSAVVTTVSNFSAFTPTSTAATSVLCDRFVANWNAVPAATSYRIDVSTTNAFSSFVGVYNDFTVAAGTSLTITGLAANTTYFYRIRAVNSCGTSVSSNIISTTTVLDNAVTANTQSGTTQTLCVDSPASTTSFAGFQANGFILQNVVQGFAYSFAVGDVFASATENIFVYNAANNVLLASNTGANGATISSWTSTLSGQIKIIVLRNGCDNTPTNTFAVTLGIVAVGNTLDSQTAFGTDTWVGHVYNYVGGSSPGGTSPATISNADPFANAQYVGYYDLATENFSQGFGGDFACFSVLSGGTVRTNIRTDTFAVRYRMKTTKSGCYVVTGNGDDGMRLYVNGALVFNQWNDQGPTNYENILINLNANDDIVFDFYENAGGNVANYTIALFNPSTNTITAPTTTNVCSGIAPTQINGSNYTYSGALNNPTIGYQWQISADNTTFVDISGANSRDYTPPAITNTGSSNIITYYRRVVFAVSFPNSCRFSSASVAITTVSNMTATSPTAAAATSRTCTGFTANWIALSPATNYNLDISTSSTFASFVAGYNNLNVGNITSFNVTGLAANTTYFYRVRGASSCGLSANSNVIVADTFAVSAPVANAASISSCSVFVASWNAQANATSYTLSVATDSGFTNFVTGYNNTNVGNVTTVNVTGYTSGPLYYRVVAVGSCGNSAPSNIITANVDVTTWNGTAWSSGVPTLSSLVFITGNYDLATLPNIDACSITVSSPAVVTVAAEKSILIQNDLTVNSGSQLIVQNSGSLVQISNSGVNTGNISYNRSARNLVRFDYVYWAAPVTGILSTSIYPTTPVANVLSWLTTGTNNNNSIGNWASTSEVMPAGKGYAIRVPNFISNSVPSTITTTFIGVPHNGTINRTISRGNYSGSAYPGTNGILVTRDDDNWNFIGNPYPSAIDADAFLAANPNIQGSIDLWTHGTQLTTTVSPFYGTFDRNYNSNNYITYNSFASQAGVATFNSKIAAGQSFFVKMIDGATAATATVTFNNALRSVLHNNSQFFRSTNNGSQNVTEKHRIWLDLSNAADTDMSRIVVGYMTGATNGYDRLFDSSTNYQSSLPFFSTIADDIYSMQAKALPFSNSDTFPLGIAMPTAGTFKISIHAVDGLFANNGQTVYLQDNLTGMVHNLSLAPYTFVATTGVNKTRFVLRFTQGSLSVNNPTINENSVLVYKDNAVIKATSVSESIASIVIYDVLGRNVFSKKDINASSFEIANVVMQQQALIVKVTLTSGVEVVKKIVF